MHMNQPKFNSNMEIKLLKTSKKFSLCDDSSSRPGLAPLTLRAPTVADGPLVTALIATCPPLDRNSAYCNLLQCSHFARTCVVAEQRGEIVGWLSAYRLPDNPSRIFVWQVAVDASARGQGLGQLMLDALMARPVVRDVTHLLTTITEENEASWALFSSFARRRGAGLRKELHFENDRHFAGKHASEFMVSIGPLTQKNF